MGERLLSGEGGGGGVAPPLVCSIGTTEPWNVAGLGLDIRSLAACGARAVTVVAGVSAQDACGVRSAVAMSAATIAAQFAALANAPIAAFRIGALLDPASVVAVAEALAARARVCGEIPIVYDPVFAPSGGGTFASHDTIAAIAATLVPQATIVTPNLAEARALLASPAETSAEPDAATPEIMAAWGRALVGLGARGALVTGGHLAGDPIDVFVDADGAERFSAPRLAGELRGTGCLLAAALAAELARGSSSRAAIVVARAFVRARFATAIAIDGARAAY